MKKAEGAFLTISELATELGLPQHILRYWETRFPQLKPLQRSGNRRYYRPSDVELARKINKLLNVQGFTVKGAQLALAGNGDEATGPVPPMAKPRSQEIIDRLEGIRDMLARALDDQSGRA